MTTHTEHSIVQSGGDRPTVILSLGTDNPRVVMDRAREWGWRCLDIRLTYETIPRQIRPIGALISQLPDSTLGRALRDIGCPTIRLGNSPHPLDTEMPAVGWDMKATGRMAAEHFTTRNFRDLAYVGAKPLGLGQEIYEAFAGRARELGCSCHLFQRPGTPFERQHDSNLIYEWQSEQLQKWLAEVPRPLGVLCNTDLQAGRICYMCGELGISVPEEIAVLGIGNNHALCESSPVPLSSIELQVETQSLLAIDLLKRLIEGRSVPSFSSVVPSGIVERQSTDVLAISDGLVSDTIRHMWDHLHWPLTVVDVAMEMGVSRRTLERRFHRALGRGVKAELLRKRLERSATLLTSTEMTVEEIAAAVGLQSRRYFHHAFLKAYGVTPGVHRSMGSRPEN